MVQIENERLEPARLPAKVQGGSRKKGGKKLFVPGEKETR